MMTHSDAKAVLKEEYRLLCQCDGFKTVFNEFSKAQNVLTIPCELSSKLVSSLQLTTPSRRSILF